MIDTIYVMHIQSRQLTKIGKLPFCPPIGLQITGIGKVRGVTYNPRIESLFVYIEAPSRAGAGYVETLKLAGWSAVRTFGAEESCSEEVSDEQSAAAGRMD